MLNILEHFVKLKMLQKTLKKSIMLTTSIEKLKTLDVLTKKLDNVENVSEKSSKKLKMLKMLPTKFEIVENIIKHNRKY